MEIRSYNWNEEDGVCKKHLLPSVPCPVCLQHASTDEEIWVEVSDSDIMVAEDNDIPLREMLPVWFDPSVHCLTKSG